MTLYSTAEDNNNEDDEDKPPENPYADPNYPYLEFVNYDDPEYQIDQSDDYFDTTSTEEQLEAMREERRRRNDEYQFQTYFRDILKNGDEYRGEWTVYKTSTFLEGMEADANGLPRLVKAARPIKVISSAHKTLVETDSEFSVDAERIIHVETSVTGSDADPVKAWKDDIDIDSGFGRYEDDKKQEEEPVSEEAKRTEAEIMANTYWPAELSAKDFRGQQGIMCVGAAYTICTAIPLAKDSEPHMGPFSEYRSEIGIQSNSLRFRIKLDYALLPKDKSKKHPPLHLKSMTVCREARNTWPRKAKVRSLADRVATEALFGGAGAHGGLYDPPPVGCDKQAARYMMLDLEGRASVLFPYLLDQDPKAFDGNGWVSTLDWTPGGMRFQVDRKVGGGAELLGLRTLELTEVQSENADQYRPRDGPVDMRQ